MRRGTKVLVGIACAVTLVFAPVAASADGVQDNQYWLSNYGFRHAWKTSKGEGITIAVIDTGVDAKVPDLKGQVLDGKDFSGKGNKRGQQPVGNDDSQHGTLVASMIAGTGKGADGNGILGVAPAAKILPISVEFDNPETTDTQVAKAVVWATDHGAAVINMSLARNSPNWPTSWDKAFAYAESKNVVIVAAAGNKGNGSSQVAAPATIPGVLGVGGVSKGGKASAQASTVGTGIAVVAPSENLLGALPGGGYALWQGTSGATPIVSGLAALIRSAHPHASAATVINQIITTADPKGADTPNVKYGYGAINAQNALSVPIKDASLNPLGSISAWITMHRPSDKVMPQQLGAPLSVPRVKGEDNTVVDNNWQVKSNFKRIYPEVLWGALLVSLAIWMGAAALYSYRLNSRR